jgi:hypothetical protein
VECGVSLAAGPTKLLRRMIRFAHFVIAAYLDEVEGKDERPRFKSTLESVTPQGYSFRQDMQ